MRRWLLLLLARLPLVAIPAVAFAQPLTDPPQNFVPPPSPTSAKPPETQLAPIYTRQTAFGIPFKIDRVDSPAQRPTAVQLHVSEDGGLSWRLYEQVDPGAGKFTFRAPHDGDYQFFVRTVDSAGRLQPAAPPKGELRVVVDTLPPRLLLTAKQSPTGEVVANWQMLDRNLRPQSLKLEFQPQGTNRWQSVTIPQDSSQGHIDTHDVTFWPGATTGKVLIRAQVIDQAGNPAVAQTEVGASVHMASDRKDDVTGDHWQAQDDHPEAGAVQWGANSVAGTPVVQRRSNPEELAPPAAVEEVSPGSQLPELSAATRQPEEVPTSEALGGPRTSANITETSVQQFEQPANEIIPLESEPDGNSTPPEAVTDPSAMGEAISGDPVDKNRAAESSASAPTMNARLAPRSGQFGFDRLPDDQRPRMVNSRKFELDYEVEAVGSNGIAKIELWGTRDWGQTWTSFGFDNDNRTPFTVAVDQEGMYGFCIVIEATNGVGGLPPRSGDKPDVWVGVDLTKPDVRLLGVEEVQQGGLGALRIQWEANDALLAANPITIAYSDRPSGPWIAVAEAIDNSGEYLWRINRRLPDQIYLQVQARDEAGNVGTGERREAVSLERLRPQGHIREIRPARDAHNATWTILR